MEAHEDELGPIDIVVIEYPPARRNGVLVANHRITAQELMDAIDTAEAVS